MVAIQEQLRPGEFLFAFLDDIYIVCLPDRVGDIHAILQEELYCHARISIHLGKTKVWNSGGEEPEACATLQVAARNVDPTATVWRGDPTLPVALQGVKILGTPVGHEAFIVHKLAEKTAAHFVLLDRIPATENVQAVWLLLLFCAAAKANFLLRTVCPELTFDYAAHHDSRFWQCLCRILRAPDKPNARMIAAVPLSEGGLGLHSAVLIRSAVHWVSWADCMHMIRNRHPSICRSILTGLSVESPLRWPAVRAQVWTRTARSWFELPSWVDLAEGLRPNFAAVEDELGMPRFGWQRVAAVCVEDNFKTHRLLPTMASAERAQMRSQAGPLASVPFVAFPSCRFAQFGSQQFRTLLLRRLHLPLPLSTRYCRCGRPFDCLGHHRAACSVAGILGKRGFPLENAAARVCREAGARVRTNVMVRDMDLVPNDRIDNRRLEVVADGLPLFGGAQLAIDTTLVSALRRDGTSRPQADSIDGVALAAARRNKARTYPEISGGDGRARLVVLAAEVGGRWSEEARKFLGALATAKARSAPVLLHACCMAPSLERFVGMCSSP